MKTVLALFPWIAVLLLALLILFDYLFIKRREKSLCMREEKYWEQHNASRVEREELRRIRAHLDLLQEDFSKLECEVAHIPGDCPLCGAL